MPSSNIILACAAGAGKTTNLVGDAVRDKTLRSALVTYTRNNKTVIDKQFYARSTTIPPNVEVMTWFAFLLREMARPYRRALHPQRVEGLAWIEGRSVPYIPQSNTGPHYFADGRYIYSDKISKFICECNRLSKGAVMHRLEQRYDHVMIDEIQDMAGYDLEVLELMLNTKIRISLVGDHRQATFRTNRAKKHSGYAGTNIIKKFEEWHAAGLAELTHQQHTHRCHQDIADLADSFFPSEPPTKSLNTTVTGHDGVFLIPSARVPEYVQRFSPRALRLDKRTNCGDLSAMNFGESKGMTFDRTLIFPHGGAKKWISTGSLKSIEKSLAKMYVGVTRARYSVGLVFDGLSKLKNVNRFD